MDCYWVTYYASEEGALKCRHIHRTSFG